MIYLDSAATTLQKPKSVQNAVIRAMQTMASPGRGGHAAAMRASNALFSSREAACELFSMDNPENVVFTMNATHGLNIAIKSLVGPGDRVVVSGYEHNAVMRPLMKLGADVVTADSPLFYEDAAAAAFAAKIDSNTKAVICNHVSNVFGFALPIERIAAICRANGVPLIIDASQSAGILPVNMDALGAAFIAMPGHKSLYGPQGTGLLLCGSESETLIEGGTGSNSALMSMPDFLPDKLEAGTHNMPGICGLEAGIRYVIKLTTDAIREHESGLIDYAAQAISQIKGAVVYTDTQNTTGSSVLSFNLEGLDCEQAASMLAESGYALRAGLHCAPLAHKSAGTFDIGTIRMSVSMFNNRSEISGFIKNVNKLSI